MTEKKLLGSPFDLHNCIIMLILASLIWTVADSAAVANTQYSLDLRSDCISVGFLDVPRDQLIYVRGRSGASTGQQQLSCYLQFNPQTDGDTLKMWLEPGAVVSDCDVILELQMSNSDPLGKPDLQLKYTLGCRTNANSIPTMEMVNGKASIRLIRKTYDDTDFSFQIGVSAKRSVADVTPGDSSSGNTGMIVGIVAGIIAIIIIAVVVCVCCYRKHHNGEIFRSKKDLPKDQSFGYENSSMKINSHDSLGSEKKLLPSDVKPKSALERFGPPPKSQQPASRVYEERMVVRGRNGVDGRDVGSRNNEMGGVQKQDTRREAIGGGARENNAGIPKPPPLPPPSTASSSSSKSVEPSSPSAPFLTALHSNPKFRKSFRENEADAEDRVRRVSNHTSTSSMTSVESSNQALIKPKLPPVPKSPTRSPSPQRRRDVAGISRARPSSSTSDVSKFEDDLKESKPLPTQKSLNDHTLKPNRDLPKERRPKERKAKEDDSDSDRGKQKREHTSRPPRKTSNKRDERDSDSDSIYSKDNKNTSRSRNKSRDRHDEREDKKTKSHERKRVDDSDLEKGHKKNRDGDKEYEGRFKKSTGVRKSKGKGPSKMGRSRSTGSALDDLESNQSYPQSKTTGSVRSLNFVEVDDEDLDSNYMPFKRAGSKQSLYASRTSLYGRKRKNSMGETVSLSSYRHDDLDSRLGDFDKGSLSRAEKDHMFKSTGDLEMRPASVFVLRECSTWTGSDKGVFVHGKRTHTKTRSVKRYNRGTQTIFSRDRRDSVGSTRSGVSSKSGISTRSNHRLKSRSKSQESLRKPKRSKDYSDDERSEDSREEQHRSRKKSHKYEESDDDRKKRSRSKDKESDSDRSSYKHNRKPKPRHRKSVDNSLEQSSSDDDDATSIAASSVVPASIYQATHQPGYPTHQPGYPPQFIPMGYPVAPYPQPGPGFVTAAPGGPPMMVPMNKPPIAAKPQIAPQPTASKWDQLVNLTEGMKKRRHQMGESINDTESVMSSMWSQPTPHASHPQNYYSPPSYKTAQAMGDPNATYSTNFHESSSNQSSPNQPYGYAYLPSESNI